MALADRAGTWGKNEDGIDFDAEISWYVCRNQKQFGPFSLRELQKGVAAGILKPDDYVWCQGFATWRLMQDIEGLFLPPASGADGASPHMMHSPSPISQTIDVGLQEPPIRGQRFASPSPAKRFGLIATHWRGGYSLGRAYWINGFLITVIMTVVVSIASTGIAENVGSSPWMMFFSASLVLVVPVTLWQLVGIWRSANNHESKGGHKAWATLAKIAVILGALRAVSDFTTALPVAIEYMTMAAGDKYGKATFRLVRNGTEMEFSGGINSGLTSQFKTFVEAAPELKVVHLESNGGRIAEGKAIANLIRENKLSTYVSTHCESACTYILLAGVQRWASPEAKIGFHSPSGPGISDDDNINLVSEEKAYLMRRGVTQDFATKALHTAPKDMWYPTNAEMVKAGVVTGTATSDQFAASNLALFSDDSKARMVLDGLPLYAGLKSAYPEDYEDLVKEWSNGARIGKSQSQIIQDGRAIVSRVLIKAMPYAETSDLIAQAKVYQQYLHTLRTIDAESCFATANSGSGARINVDLEKIMPDAFNQELEINTRIISRIASNKPIIKKDNATADLEEIFRYIGKKYPGKAQLLTQDRVRPADYQDYCVLSVEFYGRLLQLSSERAANVLRYINAN
jgi:ATP-dependent protease ClpP protease subunit